jgi:hypothetical protein
MSKFISIKGSFACRICNAVYAYSDLKDNCEGVYWFRKNSDDGRMIESALQSLGTPAANTILQKHNILNDELNLNQGDPVLLTQYVGDDWARAPYKQGIKLMYRWSYVREKRIIRAMHGDRYSHIAQYKIGDLNADLVEYSGDGWDIGFGAGSIAVGMALGPRHVWSQNTQGNTDKPFPTAILDYCNNREFEPFTMKALQAEGYYISDDEIEYSAECAEETKKYRPKGV